MQRCARRPCRHHIQQPGQPANAFRLLILQLLYRLREHVMANGAQQPGFTGPRKLCHAWIRHLDPEALAALELTYHAIGGNNDVLEEGGHIALGSDIQKNSLITECG